MPPIRLLRRVTAVAVVAVLLSSGAQGAEAAPLAAAAVATAPEPAGAGAPSDPAPSDPAPSDPAPSGPTTTVAPVAPPVDDATLHADQLAVVAARYEGALDGADQRLAGARTSLQTDDNRLAGARQDATGAAAAVTAMGATLGTAVAAARSARAAAAAAGVALGGDRARLQALAQQLYEGIVPPTASGTALIGTGLAGMSPLQAAQEDDFAQTLVQSATDAIDGDVHHDVTMVAATTRRARRAAATVTRDDGALGADRQQVALAIAAVSGAAQVAAGGEQAVVRAQKAVAAAQAAMTAATAPFRSGTGAAGVVAASTGTVTATPAAGSPSIIGPSALTAADLVGWFDASGDEALTTATIEQLAGWYISEGAAEGVRGDVAFAQAMIETGGFTSPDAINLNNYAGIGHCDSCASGWKFPSPLLGVRGQMQLLRAYAEPDLTTADLASPPAIPDVAPELQYRRGCCGTWQSLTGVWATDPIYGPVVLNLYQQMLDYALTNPSVNTTTAVPAG